MTIPLPSLVGRRRSRRGARGALALALVLGVTALPGVATADPSWEKVLDITFPTVPGSRFSNDYGAARSGGARRHCATDIMGRKHQPVYAARGGTIGSMPLSKPSYGYTINIKGDDGRRYSYLHLNDDTPGTHDASAGPEHAYAPGLRVGSTVQRGQLIGYMGNSGNAKGGVDHLHFEIHDPGINNPACALGGGADRLNPVNSLYVAVANGRFGGTPAEPARPVITPRSIDAACPPALTANGFIDGGGNHTRAIACVAGWGIASGTGHGRFEPDRSVSREQLATFVVNTLAQAGRPLPTAANDHFHDDDASAHHDAVNRVAGAGIVNGTGPGTFAPGAPVSRGQMTTILARTYAAVSGRELPTGPNAFPDDDNDNHHANINRLATARIATGHTDGTYRPLAPVSRAQMATFIARSLDLLVTEGTARLPA